MGLLLGITVAAGAPLRAVESAPGGAAALQPLLEAIPPLTRPIGARPPIFLWSPEIPETLDATQLDDAFHALHARGLCLFLRWQPDFSNTLAQVRRVAGVRKRLGLPVAVDATPVAHGLFPKGDAYAHLAPNGKPFRNSGLSWDPGCPFRVSPVQEPVRACIESFARAQQALDLPLDYWISDWELDGPNEWKHGWTAARQCTLCRARIPDIETNFPAFQAAVRQLRSAMQRENLVRPVQAAYPAVRIGNYAMNPHDGFRYYWDYFEEESFGKPVLTAGVPYVREQQAYHRPWWRGEFEAAGYNLAAPVLYAWYHLFLNYTCADPDYRWFYGLLREATSAGRHTPADTPLIPFVHARPIGAPEKATDQPPGFAPLSVANIRELAWHILLRGASSFILWAPGDEVRELRPFHAAYDESLAYPEFFDKGAPVCFDLPGEPGVVVSARHYQGRYLVRRTDFAATTGTVVVSLDPGGRLLVPAAPGRCLILTRE
jgi:hypothetical protein